MVELAVIGSAQLGDAAGGRQRDAVMDVLAVHLPVILIGVHVAREGGVIAVVEHRLDAQPFRRLIALEPRPGAGGRHLFIAVAAHEAFAPIGAVHEQEGPAHLVVLGERLLKPGKLGRLFFRPGAAPLAMTLHALAVEERRIQHDEQRALVLERIIIRSEALFPDLRHGFVRVVVIARHIEERRIELRHPAVKLVPFRLDLRAVVGIALDQVADADREGGLEQVHLVHRRVKHPRTRAAGIVGDHDEMEARLGIQRFQARPGRGTFRDHERLDARGVSRRALAMIMIGMGVIMTALVRESRRGGEQGGDNERAEHGDLQLLEIMPIPHS